MRVSIRVLEMAFPWIKLDDLALLPNFTSDLRKDFIFFTCEM